jgi:uncharacterized YigZ family protein
MGPLLVPRQEARAEIEVLGSRFITSLAGTSSVDAAKIFIERVKGEYSDATHNVTAFVIGHGATVIAHSSDDGEPSGTAGRPALAVLQGSGLGDVGVVVTRYYGGRKLGTGGLVRAYSDAVRAVLAITPFAEKVITTQALIVTAYPHFERVKLLTADHAGQILEERFSEVVNLQVRVPAGHFSAYRDALMELTSGTIQVRITAEGEVAHLPFHGVEDKG